MASRDSVSQREAGEKTAEKMTASKPSASSSTSTTSSKPSASSGSRDTVAQKAAGAATASRMAVSLNEKSSSSSSSSASRSNSSAPAPKSSTAVSAPRNQSKSPTSSGSSNGSGGSGPSAAPQSTMREGGFDALMRQLDATTTPGKPESNLLTDIGALDAVMAGGFPSGVVDGLGGWLAEQDDYRKSRIQERRDAGVVPSEGPIDWNAIGYDWNTRGPGSWFGGIGEAAAAPRVLQDIPTHNGGLIEREKQGVIDPQTGFVLDPDTQTWYRPDYRPAPDRLPSEVVDRPGPDTPAQAPFTPSPSFSGFDVLDGLAAGVEAEQRRLGAGTNGLPATPNLPRPRPDRPGDVAPVRPAMAVDPWDAPMPPSNTNPAPAQPLPGMVPGAKPIQPAGPEKEPTVWERAVDMAGGALGNTLVGGAVKSLFPDMWYSAGEAFKGNGSGGDGSPAIFVDTPSSSGSSSPGLVGFIDLNNNGIDDRLEGYVPPTVRPASSAPAINYGSAVFPNMPPYNPGVSPEWQYFRPGYAQGGLVQYAEGGAVEAVAAQSPNGTPPMGGLDPRITIIADAEDALTGESPNPDEALALFVQMFGEEALEILKTNVQSGMTLRGHQRKKPRMAKGRFIEGAGGPTDDAIPAVIDGEQPAALSDGEFVLPAAAVRGAGDGDKNKGAAKLEQLSAMLAGNGQ